MPARRALRCRLCQARPPRGTVPGRLPKGWKEIAGPVCRTCKRTRFCIRAIEFPVDACLDEPWPEFLARLGPVLRATTQCANWMMSQFLAAEKLPNEKQAIISALPLVSLYRAATRRFPGLDPNSISALEQDLRGRWRRSRFAVLRQTERPLWFRGQDGLPYPIRQADWHFAPDNAGRPVISVRLGRGRVRLALRAGREFRRQLARLAELRSGAAAAGAAALYYRPVSRVDAAHRPAATRRDPGGGARKYWRVILKLVGYFPKPAAAAVPRTAALAVATDPNAFLVAQVVGAEDRPPWVLNADHIRRWCQAHTVYLQRLAQDLKYEKRWPARARRQMNAARAARCTKQQQRLSTACHQLAACLAAYAMRQRVATVLFDDRCRDYLPHFPWFVFKERLRQKLDALGIQFSAAQDVGGPDDE